MVGSSIRAFGIDIDSASVCFFRSGMSKHEALDQLVEALCQSGRVRDREAFRQALYDRETVQSTGIGGGVAIPHVRTDAVSDPTIGIGISKDGIDFGSLDGRLVHIVVVFAMTAGSQRQYLGLLAQAMTTLRNPDVRARLSACSCVDEVSAVLGECCP